MLKAKIEIFTDFLGHSYKERLSGFGYEENFPLIQPTRLSWVLDNEKELGRKRCGSDFPGSQNSLCKKPNFKKFHDVRKGKTKYEDTELGRGQITEGLINHTKELRFYSTGERELKNVKHGLTFIVSGPFWWLKGQFEVDSYSILGLRKRETDLGN